jgi:hypothetical protein
MSAAPGERFEVEDLDADNVLAFLRDLDEEARRIEAFKLRAAAHWADLHPATAETGAAAPDGGVLDADELLGGEGTPAVAAFTPEDLAVVLQISPTSAAAMVADALDLRHRLPHLWRAVMRLQAPAWLARRVAQQTRRLPKGGARYVDEALAARGSSWGTGIADRVVAEAIARFDPVEHARREDRGRGSWDVKISHPAPTEFAGTSELWARGDSIALQALYDQICAQAHQRHLDGDTDHLGARKAKALTELTGDQAPLPAKMRLYVHVKATDLDTEAVGDVEKLGPATLTKIKDWVGHRRVTIRPVLDPRRDDGVETHDPPPWMRELVILRDRHCVFPGCQVDARSCDLDHITPYDEHGPPDQTRPGQTRPENLACLCRRHHRAKTLGLWRYGRTTDGSYLWKGPYGTTCLVTPRGTVPIGSTSSWRCWCQTPR